LLDFREDAYKVAIVISDSIPATAYWCDWTANWYPSGTSATFYAIEELIKKKGFLVFFSQPEDVYSPMSGYECHYEAEKNPFARDEWSGFAALEKQGVATRLGWPFRQEEIPVPTAPPNNQRYYVLWYPSYSMGDEVVGGYLSDYVGKYRYQVNIQVPDPDNSGAILQGTYVLPLEKPDVSLNASLTDEIGIPYGFQEVKGRSYYLAGDRRIEGPDLGSDENPAEPVRNFVFVSHTVFR